MPDTTANHISLAYVHNGNAKDIRTWSGLVFNIANALQKQGVEISYIDSLSNKQKNFFEQVYDKFYSKFVERRNKQYQGDRTIKIAKRYAKKIETKLPENIDAIFAPVGTVPMAFLKSDKKKIIFNDATFAAIVDYYPGFTNLCSKTLKEGSAIEKKAFENADLLLFASDWAAESAIRDYGISPSKIKVVPFGANIENEYSDAEITEIVQKRCASLNNKCNLLFVGVDWKRKGGDIVLEAAKILHSQNINIHLDIVGIKDLPLSLPDYVTNHGYISKKNEDGKKKLTELFREAHFFVLPARNECFGVVFSEASSFGLPSISTKTGGIVTAIKDNVNGMKFALSDSPEKYAAYIKKMIADKTGYEKLCLSSFDDYKKRLNWNVIGEQIVTAIKEIL